MSHVLSSGPITDRIVPQFILRASGKNTNLNTTKSNFRVFSAVICAHLF